MPSSDKLYHLNDAFLQNIKSEWFSGRHPQVTPDRFIAQAQEWFRSSRLNDIRGWESFDCVDIILGCTHFIESLLIKHSNQVQVLPYDYAYYALMGIPSTEPKDLRPRIPLIVSLPNWRYLDVRPDWQQVLDICHERCIDIHVDMAWMPVAREISLDLDHPCIKSFAMSLSKYSMEWNRIGLRWCRQRTMDSVTMFNQYQGAPNSAAISCGSWIMHNLDRDYAWKTYGPAHLDICKQQGYHASKMIHVAHRADRSGVVGIGKLLSLGSKAPVSE